MADHFHMLPQKQYECVCVVIRCQPQHKGDFAFILFLRDGRKNCVVANSQITIFIWLPLSPCSLMSFSIFLILSHSKFLRDTAKNNNNWVPTLWNFVILPLFSFSFSYWYFSLNNYWSANMNFLGSEDEVLNLQHFFSLQETISWVLLILGFA